MAISFKQSKSAGGTGTAPALTFNTAPTANNLLVCCVHSAGNTAITMSSTGWTALTSIAGGSGTTQFANRIFWKLALPGESSTITATAGSNAWAIVAAEYNTLGRTPIVDKENAQANASSTSQPTPSVNPKTSAETLVFCSSGVRSASTTFSAETIAGSSTGVTEREDVNQATNACNACLYDAIYTTGKSSVSGAATASLAAVGGGNIAIFQLPAPAFINYQFVKVGNGMSVTEKIR